MNECAELRGQLEDAALGVTATPALNRHLTTCAACTTELARQRTLAGRLDAAILAIVRAEPPPQLLAGVSARLRPAPRPFVAWVAAAACVLLLTFGLRAFERPPGPQPDLSALTAWHSPTDSLLEPPGTPIEPRSSPRRRPGGTDDS